MSGKTLAEQKAAILKKWLKLRQAIKEYNEAKNGTS